MAIGITRDQFVAVLGRAAAGLEGLPVSQAILRHFHETLQKGEPNWWKKVEKAWSQRTFNFWNEPWQLLLAAVHFEALNDENNPLVPYFPSCGGTPEADPSSALDKFLASLPVGFFENLEKRHPRNYFFAFSDTWVLPGVLFFKKREMPYYLVQLNAGAGLDLTADLVSAVWADAHGEDVVAARIGLDPAPLLVEDIIQRRWMTAGLNPENLPAIEALDKAIESLLDGKRRDPNFVQLVECPQEEFLGFIKENIPPNDPDVGFFLYTVAYSNKLDDLAYANLKDRIGELLSTWGDRGLWVELEPVRGEIFSTTTQAIAHRMIEGKMAENVLFRYDGISKSPTLNWEGAESFLDSAPRKPAKKPTANPKAG